MSAHHNAQYTTNVAININHPVISINVHVNDEWPYLESTDFWSAVFQAEWEALGDIKVWRYLASKSIGRDHLVTVIRYQHTGH